MLTLSMGRKIDFYKSIDLAVKEKIQYVFSLIQLLDRVPVKFLKHLTATDGLYEIRVKSKGNIYRIFCCLDEGNIIVLFNCFQKKTQKNRVMKLKSHSVHNRMAL